MRAYPIDEYPVNCKAAAAIMLMIMNNLDRRIAQFPHELVTYGTNGQVFSNWAQVCLRLFFLKLSMKLEWRQPSVLVDDALFKHHDWTTSFGHVFWTSDGPVSDKKFNFTASCSHKWFGEFEQRNKRNINRQSFILFINMSLLCRILLIRKKVDDTREMFQKENQLDLRHNHNKNVRILMDQGQSSHNEEFND